MVTQVFELFVEDLQTLVRDLVGIHVVNRYLQIIQAGLVEFFDLINLKIIAVRDQAGDHAVVADPGDYFVDLRMHHWLSA